MGRRSIKSTKSGKFMNPTDQARKEARKKELKKNKKQRLLVRTNVLKNKDPGTIIEELDKLDEIEYNVNEPPQLAEKVLKDKRRKLKETLDRVMKLYQKDEPTYWNELKLIENDYERRRFHRIQFYESVKQAEAVSNVEDIPLPPSIDMDIGGPPPAEEPKPVGILKNPTAVIQAPPTQFLGPGGKEPPGVPMGPPIDLSSSESSEESEDDEPESVEKSTAPPIPASSSSTAEGEKKSVRFDTAIDEMDKFMKEVEEEFKSLKEEDLLPPGLENEKSTVTAVPAPPPPPPPQQTVAKVVTEGVSIPLRPFFTPGAGPGTRPYFPFPPPPLAMQPPPPRMTQRFNNSSRFRRPPPSLNPHPKSSGEVNIVSEAMIQAKPQIRSLSADVTRFVPVAVKTRREEPSTSKEWKPTPTTVTPQKPKSVNKDDAYSDFMKEMEGLL